MKLHCIKGEGKGSLILGMRPKA